MKKLLFVFAMLSFLVLGQPSPAHAMEFRKGDRVLVTSSEQIEGSVLLVSEDITVDGVINGDLYCAGKHVRITGQVFGDVICAGQFVDISGAVDGSVRVAAQELDIDAEVTRNVTTIGQTITVSSDSYIAGEVAVAGQDITLNGEISDEVVAYGSALTVGGQIGGDAHLNGNSLKVLSTSALLGSTSFNGPESPQVEDGASVSGQIDYTQTQAPSKNRDVSPRMSQGFSLGNILFPMLTMGIAGFILFKLFPGFMNRVNETLQHSPLHAGLFGLAVVIGGPIVLILMCLTLIGIPLALIAFLFWLILSLLAHTFTIRSIGNFTLTKINQEHTPVKELIVGTVVLSILNAIPVVGLLTSMISFFVGIGAASKALLSYRNLTN